MTKPLAGKSVIVTRARGQAGVLAEQLEELGAEVLAFPVIDLVDPDDWEPADAAIAGLGGYKFVVFTSVNAVERFLARLNAVAADAIRNLRSATVLAVGPATATALESAGIEVARVPAEHRAEGVLASLAEEGFEAGDTVLIPRALEAREVLPETLAEWGAAVDVVPVYRNVRGEGDPETLRRLGVRDVDAATFTSSSTVRNFVEIVSEAGLREALDEIVIASIGPVTSATARELGLHVDVEPSEYTVPSLVEALSARLCRV